MLKQRLLAGLSTINSFPINHQLINHQLFSFFPSVKPNVLIVDDDEEIRTQMKWAVGQDYEVVLAGDRLGALEAFGSHRPAVTILDLGPATPSKRTGSHGRFRTEILEAGDVGYIPQGYGHSIENIGDLPCKVLFGFWRELILRWSSDCADHHVFGDFCLDFHRFPAVMPCFNS